MDNRKPFTPNGRRTADYVQLPLNQETKESGKKFKKQEKNICAAI